MEVEAVEEGVLGRILVGDGTEGVKVNDADRRAGGARRSSAGGGADAAPATAQPSAPRTAAARSRRPARPRNPPPKARRRKASRQAAAAAGAADEPSPRRPRRRPSRPHPAEADGHAGGRRRTRLRLARSRAAWRSRPASTSRAVQGSGPNGRIVKSDIEAALARGPAQQAPAAQPPQPTAAPAHRNRPPRRRRSRQSAPPAAPHKAGAAQHHPRRSSPGACRNRRQTIPHFYVTDGHRDRRAAQAARRPQRQVAEGRTGRLQALGQRPGHQGRRPRPCAATRTSTPCWTDDAHPPVRRRRRLGGGGDRRPASSPRSFARPTRRAWPRSASEMKDLAARAKAEQAEARGVPGRRLLDLQHGHVRRSRASRRDHQPAAGRDPGGGGGRAAAGGARTARWPSPR